MPRIILLFLCAACLAAEDGLLDEVTQGALRVRTAGGQVVECPLTHTAYTVEIAGSVAQVDVVQTFTNTFAEALEAVYVFPLSNEAGINGMTMEIGGRRIVGALLKRADALKLYQDAVAAGKTASRLDQERPNIFTQTVGNLPPGKTVRIRIAYAEQLAYDSGTYGFHLPLVVGPRYLPGIALGGAPSGTGVLPDTTRVPDGSRISPPVLAPGMRTGHDVSISVRLDAGIAVRDLVSANHQVTIARSGPTTASIALVAADNLANKDFVLRYAVAGASPELSAVTHVAADGGYLLLTLHPAQLVATLAERQPRDLCFLVDVSGSMMGQPLEQAKAAMKELLALCGAQDRIQVIAFASQCTPLFADYQTVTVDTIAQALHFVDIQRGSGGTEMLAGITSVLTMPPADRRMRMAVMLTDGFIGNEKEIIGEVARRGDDQLRFWCIGIGSSPNRFLIDGVATAGGGMGTVIGLNDAVQPVIEGLMARLQHTQLDHLRLDWGGLPITAMVPARLPSLWSGKPVQICARFPAGAPLSGTVTMHGLAEGVEVSIPVQIDLPAAAPHNRAARTLWARQRIGELRQRDSAGDGYDSAAEITQVSLAYSVMSEFTSFIAVDEAVVNPGGHNRQENVAVPLPDGVSPDGLLVVPSAALDGLAPAICGTAEASASGSFMAIGAGGGSVGMFGSRSGGGRKRAVAHGGGSVVSEDAVGSGLKFLKRHQEANGSWAAATYQLTCSEGPRCEPGVGGAEETIALTAQAVLAFLGSGYDHKVPSKYKETVRKGVEWTLAQQAPDGRFGTTIEAQACATATLAEAYAMTADQALRQPAQQAVMALLAMRIPGPDGHPLAWGDHDTFDTETTTCCVMALKSALAGGLHIGDGLSRAGVWLDLAWQAANHRWFSFDATSTSDFPARWSPISGCFGSDPAAAAWVAVLVGRKPPAPLLMTLANRIVATSIATGTALPTDLRSNQYTAYALFQIGGDQWTTWNKTNRKVLVAHQQATAGCFNGSWEPQAQTYSTHERGRLQSTIYALLRMEIYYHYTPVKNPTEPLK